jgi:hypothetical protein
MQDHEDALTGVAASHFSRGWQAPSKNAPDEAARFLYLSTVKAGGHGF